VALAVGTAGDRVGLSLRDGTTCAGAAVAGSVPMVQAVGRSAPRFVVLLRLRTRPN